MVNHLVLHHKEKEKKLNLKRRAINDYEEDNDFFRCCFISITKEKQIKRHHERVCVCVCERERDRELRRIAFLQSIMTETTVLDFDLILMYLFNYLLRFNSIPVNVMMDDAVFF